MQWNSLGINKLINTYLKPPPRLWLNVSPKVNDLRLLGKFTCSTVWLNLAPKVSLAKLLGKVVSSRFWLYSFPNLRFWRLSGNTVCSKLLLKSLPKIRPSKLPGNSKPSTPSLKQSSKVRYFKLSGNFLMNCKDRMPSNSRTPSKARSSLFQPCIWHQAAETLVATYVQCRVTSLPRTSPCCHKLWVSQSGEVPCANETLTPAGDPTFCWTTR